MADSSAKRTLTGLAGGVLNDVRELAHETADLLRQISASSQKTGRAGSLLIAGTGIALIGLTLLCLMIVHLLAWAVPEQPAWVWYAAVGVPMLGIGAVLTAIGRKNMKSLNPLHEQSARVMKDATKTATHLGETVESARQSLHDTAESVREAIDVHEQFKKRPWTVISGAAALGYLGGALLHDGPERPAPSGKPTKQDLARARGMLARLAQQLAPEVAQLKGLALGALLGVVRDLAMKSSPQQMERELSDVINGITVKLGGTPAKGPVLAESSNANGSSRTQQ